jgi:hypothetical protein
MRKRWRIPSVLLRGALEEKVPGEGRKRRDASTNSICNIQSKIYYKYRKKYNKDNNLG